MGIIEFKKKIMSDEAFAEKFAGVENAEELVAKAKAEGFNFTVEDVNANTELSDAELEAVAGGKTIFAKTYFVTKGCVFAKNYFVKE